MTKPAAQCNHDFPKWRKARLLRQRWVRRCRKCGVMECSTADPSSLEVMEKTVERFASALERLAKR